MNQLENLRPIKATENCVQTRQKRSKNLIILTVQTMRTLFFFKWIRTRDFGGLRPWTSTATQTEKNSS